MGQTFLSPVILRIIVRVPHFVCEFIIPHQRVDTLALFRGTGVESIARLVVVLLFFLSGMMMDDSEYLSKIG